MSKSIKFEHNCESVIKFNVYNTDLGNTMALGPLALTKRHTYPKNSARILKYATDEQGLVEAISASQELLIFLNISTTALGVFLAYIDAKEVESELTSIGWLISALSGLANLVDCERTELQYALDQAQKSPDK